MIKMLTTEQYNKKFKKQNHHLTYLLRDVMTILKEINDRSDGVTSLNALSGFISSMLKPLNQNQKNIVLFGLILNNVDEETKTQILKLMNTKITNQEQDGDNIVVDLEPIMKKDEKADTSYLR